MKGCSSYRCLVLLLLFYLSLSFLSCNKGYYSRDEAERSLKVMNSDLVNLFGKASEQKEFEVLNFVWNQPSAKVPFPNEKFVANDSYSPYDFSRNKGIYTWDSKKQLFAKTDTSKNVLFVFDLPDFRKGQLLIENFKSQPISSRPEFPTQISAKLLSESKNIISLTHFAEIKDDLPLITETKVEGSDYNFTVSFNRTKENETGTASLTAIFEADNVKVIKLNIDTKIGYSPMGYFFNKINFTFLSFNHLIEGKIDYDKVNPTANDYASSFNQNSTIIISEKPFNKKVGKIILDYTNDGKLLDYFILFSDGQKVLLSEYLPFINKILNLKI